MTSLLHSPVIATGILLFVHFVLRRLKRSSRFPLPPGPKGYPLIGNLLEIGQEEKPWEVYSDIAKEHGALSSFGMTVASDRLGRYAGDMFMLKSLGTNVLVLSSLKRVNELLEQRSNIYSGRPYLPMLCGQ